MIKIRIRDLNAHIVCSLCAGYFINATTINECLHTFCKSCLFQFLETSKSCPQCGVRIHETQPHLHLKADHVLQDIVFKLLPDLRDNEEERIEEFYRVEGIPRDRQRDEDYKVEKLPMVSNTFNPESHLYSNDDQLVYMLQPYDTDYEWDVSSDSKIYKSSVRTCVHHIKKLLLDQIQSAKIVQNSNDLSKSVNINDLDTIIDPDKKNESDKGKQENDTMVNNNLIEIDKTDRTVNVDYFQIIIGNDVLLNDNCPLQFAKIISDNMMPEKKSKLILKYRINPKY